MLNKSETSCPSQPAPYLSVSLFLCCLTMDDFSEHPRARSSLCSGATAHPFRSPRDTPCSSFPVLWNARSWHSTAADPETHSLPVRALSTSHQADHLQYASTPDGSLLCLPCHKHGLSPQPPHSLGAQRGQGTTREHQKHMEHSNREPYPYLQGNAFTVPQKRERRERDRARGFCCSPQRLQRADHPQLLTALFPEKVQ